MPQSLPALENQRTQIQQRIAQLGDMRAGSISTTGGRCGNPRCHCRQPNDPGHGPYLRLTRKVDGKTVTETFASPAVRQKAEREIAAYHRFRELSRELLQVNETICGLRPVEEQDLSPQKKNGGGDPARSRPGNRAAAGGDLPQLAPDRPSGFRSRGNGHSRRDASCRGRPVERVVAGRAARR